MLHLVLALISSTLLLGGKSLETHHSAKETSTSLSEEECADESVVSCGSSSNDSEAPLTPEEQRLRVKRYLEARVAAMNRVKFQDAVFLDDSDFFLAVYSKEKNFSVSNVIVLKLRSSVEPSQYLVPVLPGMPGQIDREAIESSPSRAEIVYEQEHPTELVLADRPQLVDDGGSLVFLEIAGEVKIASFDKFAGGLSDFFGALRATCSIVISRLRIREPKKDMLRCYQDKIGNRLDKLVN